MRGSKDAPHPQVDQFEQMASDLSVAIWNRIAQLPQFDNLHPNDFSVVFESVHAELRRLWRRSPGKRDH